MNKRDVEFLFEIGSLNNTQRGWRQHLGSDVATVPAHTFRVCWLALLIARGEKVKDEEKVLKMALVHDIAETRVSDLSYVQKVYVAADEQLATHDIFSKTSVYDFFTKILSEYEERKSIEAKIVKDADNLDVDLEIKEFIERGSLAAKKWSPNRKLVRNKKLYTKSARKIWDLIQKVDVSSWHLKSNKWNKPSKASK